MKQPSLSYVIIIIRLALRPLRLLAMPIDQSPNCKRLPLLQQIYVVHPGSTRIAEFAGLENDGVEQEETYILHTMK